MPAINELATDKNWRTRLTIIEKFPVLARQLVTAKLISREKDSSQINWAKYVWTG